MALPHERAAPENHLTLFECFMFDYGANNSNYIDTRFCGDNISDIIKY